MFIRNACLSLLSTSSIFLTLSVQIAGTPNSSSQTTDAVGVEVASRVIEVLAAVRPSQSRHSSASSNSSYQAANSTVSFTSLQSTLSFNSSSVPITGGQTIASNVIEGLAALGSSQSLHSFISAESYTAGNGVNLPISSHSIQSTSVSGASNTAADWPASTVAGATAVSQQSASSAASGASFNRFAIPDATDSTQSVTVTIPPPVSTSSVPSAGANGTLTPLPNVATVILDGTRQVIYKQTFANLRSITAAENITTALPQSSSQSTSNAILPVGAPDAIVVGPAGIWYRIGTIGPPIGPPDLPKLTIGGGRSLFCTLFPFFCPGTKSMSPPGTPDPPKHPDPPGNGQNPPTPKDDPEPESDGASQSRGEATNMPSSTQVPNTKATYSAQSQTTRSTTPTQNSTTRLTTLTQKSTTRSASSTQSLISFDWITQNISADIVFVTTSENFSAVSSYLQAEFTSMGIAFDETDAMAGLAPANATNATTTVASSAGKEIDITGTATNGAGIIATAAVAAGSADGPAGVFTQMTSTSSSAGQTSNSAAALVASTVVNEPPPSSATQPAPTLPPSAASPLFMLACTQS